MLQAETMLYFAYGSNMCTERLRAADRVPSAEPQGKAKLAEHVLRVHKLSKKDCSAKADAYHTGDPNDTVWGVMFRVDVAEKPKLDRAEGLGHGYEEKNITVTDANGNEHRAVIYFAEASYIQSALLPYTWYKRFVVEGAKQHSLPTDYIARIEAMPATEDPDRARDSENRRIS
jgi:gamma-glutamylcyclotransferase